MSVHPLPPSLAQTLPNPRTPWHTSPKVFSRLQFQPTQTDPYITCELTRDDPEWKFVTTYFEHDTPTNRMIRRIFCIHNPSSTLRFEANIPSMEQESLNPHFAPDWHKESHLPLREKAFKRWEDSTAPFSPFFVTSASGRKDIYKNVKIIPLWHGSTEAKCQSVAQTGFTFFGKTTLRGAAAGGSTDLGFFGSGIYFTNSARYAADIYSDGHLLLAWVSMREPFPVVSDKVTFPPAEPSDMRALKGKHAYKNYNVHYVPVVSVDPLNPDCPVYYPCALGQLPMCDEYAVFQPAQTLARFWVELDFALLKNPSVSPSSPTVEELFDYLVALLGKIAIKQESSLTPVLEQKLATLGTLDQTAALSPEDLKFYTFTKKLLDGAGKVNEVVLKQLVPAKMAAALKQPSFTPAPQPAAAAVSIPRAQAGNPSLPLIAFGAAKWEQYFGVHVEEPPLPADINEILEAKCPFFSTFFSKKKIKDTHFLTLIPEGMTLERLEELALHAKYHKIGFRTKGDATWRQHGKVPTGTTHWVLMTNDVIPGSRKRSWKEQQALGAQYKWQGYELLSALDAASSILLTYVQTGQQFYTDSPWTYTRCVEQVVGGPSQRPVAIGGFASEGLYVDVNDGVGESGGVGVARKFF